ncbi:armadillo-type protein [Dipodascopsis tothii]|uniref:armadillo-type protein n=1 Tax=Dipodascopsis tothii TaxID=44089 RepID=UPI0034CDAA38
MALDRGQAFQALKAVCVPLSQAVLGSGDLARDRDVTARLEQLTRALDGVDGTPGLGDYVFFPLSHLLRRARDLSDRQKELVLRIVAALVAQCWAAALPAELFRQLLMLVNFLTYGPPGPAATAQTSEETRAAGAGALHALFVAAEDSEPLRTAAMAADAIPALGHSISSLLRDAQDAVAHECQLAALAALDTLLLRVLRDGDVLATFFPGAISTLNKIMSPQFAERGFRVLVAALALFGGVVAVVMADEDVAPVDQTESAEPRPGPRTPAWCSATKGQLKVSLDPVVRLRTHARPQVRVALAQSLVRVLAGCSASLDNCRAILVETLVYLSHDSDVAVAEAARPLEKLGRSAAVQDTLKELVYDWLGTLQRALNVHDSSVRDRLIGNVRVGLQLLMAWGVELGALEDAVSASLAGALEIGGGSGLVDDAGPTLAAPEMALVPGGGPQPFPHVGLVGGLPATTAGALERLVRLCGSSAMGPGLVDEHVQRAADTQVAVAQRATSLWLSLHLVRGLHEHTQLVHSVDSSLAAVQAVEVLGELSAGLVEVVNDDDAASEADTALALLALEGMSLAAELMGKDYEIVLMDVLYPVLNVAGGAASPVLRRHAIVALVNMARAVGYTDLRPFLVDNVDYIVDSVSLKLGSLDISPRTPRILAAVIKLAGSRAIPYMDDVVASVFVILDSFHGYAELAESFFGVLKALVEETALEYSAGRLAIEDRPRAARAGVWTREALVEALTRQFGELPGDGAEKIDEAGDRADEPEPDGAEPGPDAASAKPPAEPWDSPVPEASYMIVRKITAVTQHYLSHSSPTLRQRLLDMVNDGLPVLASSPKSFLPLVNEIWPDVVDRLDDAEAFVVANALRTIGQLCRLAGDFMSRRLQAAWPAIRRHIPPSPPREREGRFSRRAVLLEAALGCVAAVVAHTQLPEDVFGAVLDVSAPYLRSHGDLRAALDSVSADAVWLQTAYACGLPALGHPGPGFAPLRI